MNKRITGSIILLTLITLILIISNLSINSTAEDSTTLEFLPSLDQESTNSFSNAVGTRNFEFPKDFGAHPEYMTEWWYYTGNIFTEDGRHFGYQLTFFRRALSSEPESNLSGWASQQIYLAHLAITDTSENKHFAFDEISRDSIGLAGTSTDPYFSIWLKNWEINQIDETRFRMRAETEEISIDFLLTDLKGIVLQGNKGFSQKGEALGNASYYFSQTRLETQGTLKVNGTLFNVIGFSWMDHEFGTSTLGANQVGWDWFSIQLDNDTEIMLFQIRDIKGAISPYSSGTIISQNNTATTLGVDDFEITPTQVWKTSDHIEYPSDWEITIEGKNIKLIVSPVIPDQEMKLFFRYWEGAVVITGSINSKQVSGYGYVELTGYAQSMQGVF